MTDFISRVTKPSPRCPVLPTIAFAAASEFSWPHDKDDHGDTTAAAITETLGSSSSLIREQADNGVGRNLAAVDNLPGDGRSDLPTSASFGVAGDLAAATHVLAYGLYGERDTASEFALADGNGNTNGMAYANNRFYLLDSADDKVYAYHADGTCDLDSDFGLAEGNVDASGIVRAGDRFHVVDYADRKVYAYTSDGSPNTSADFALAEDAPKEPTGIAHADGLFHVLGDGRAFAYRPEGQREPGLDLVLDADNEDASGITRSAGFYVLDRADKKVCVYRDSRCAPGIYLVRTSNSRRYGGKVEVYATDGARSADLDFRLDGSNRIPVGIAHADGAFYVVDISEDKVFAYAADGTRRDDLDFHLYPRNGRPVGVTAHNGTFYVVENLDARVYAYPMSGR